MHHLRSHQPSRHPDAFRTHAIPEEEEIAVMSDEVIAIDRFFLSDPRFSLDDLESVDMVGRSRRQNVKKGTRSSPFEATRYRVLDTVSVLAICFFCVCGGPLGPDQIIAADPVTGTISLVLFPMLCSGPFAYIIAELCSALPEDGGHVMWVLNAFGPFMAFQEGYWAWLSGIFARVLRIGLLYELLATAFSVRLSQVEVYFIKAGVAIFLSIPSLLGARVLSKTLLVCLLLCVLLPFAVLTGWGFSQASLVSREYYVQTATDAPTDWVYLVNTLYWSYNGFYLTSTFGGRVLNPARTFPHAIYFTYLIIVMLYLLPLLASYSATRTHWLAMENKEFVVLAKTIGGAFLHGVIVFATACGLAGMFVAQTFCEGYQAQREVRCAVHVDPLQLGRDAGRVHFPVQGPAADHQHVLGLGTDPHHLCGARAASVAAIHASSSEIAWRDAAHVRTLRAAAVCALLHCGRDVQEAVHRGIMRRTRRLWGRVLHENHARVQSEAREAREETPLQEASTAAMAINGNGNGGAEAATVAAVQQQVEPVKTPIERFNEVVEKNPLDFNSWVQLLALVENEPSLPLETVESTFDRFLAEFPLCFGYWNKYAQYEYALVKRLDAEGTPVVDQETAAKKARAVYERGVVAVRHSVDMWVKYCEFLIQTIRVPVDEARAALESAVEACGSDPMAGPLWDSYITLETVNNDMLRLNQVFKRIMYQPLSNVEEFWEKYNQFVLAQQLHTLATTDELNALAGEDEMMDEGLLRVKVVNSVEAVKNKTVEAMYRRQAFEAGIDRSYFHVTPVSDSALKNWHNYLDYEEVAGDEARCEVLYERCLIACANYEQFWIRYANWKEKSQGFQAAIEVYSRAVNIFLKYRASIYLEYASFLEAHEKYDNAKEAYMKVLDDVAPSLVEAFLRYCNFERRRGDFEAAKQGYQRALEKLTTEQPDVYGHIATCYATFMHKKVGDVELARSVFDDALKVTTTSLPLWLNYVHFEISAGGEDLVARVEKVYQSAISDSSELSTDEKSDLWFQYVDFMETYADNVAAVREVLANEITWKRKNAMPRERALKLLNFESSAQASSSANGYNHGAVAGVKRPRYDAVVTPPVRAAPIVVGAAAATPAAYSQYYQGYQGYGAQAYPQADTTQATTAAYTQAQYAAYYQQQAQR